MASTQYLCVHNSFEKHHLGAILLIPLQIVLHFIFSMTISFLQCFSHIIATPIRDSGISHLYIPMYCTFWLVVQLRYAVFPVCLPHRVVDLNCSCLELDQVMEFLLGLLKLNVFLKQHFSHTGAPIPADVMVLFHSRNIPEIILILSCFSADNQQLIAGPHPQNFAAPIIPLTQLTGEGKLLQIATPLLFLHSDQTDRNICLGKIQDLNNMHKTSYLKHCLPLCLLSQTFFFF